MLNRRTFFKSLASVAAVPGAVLASKPLWKSKQPIEVAQDLDIDYPALRSTPAIKRYIHKIAEKLDCIATQYHCDEYDEELWQLTRAGVWADFVCTDIVKDNPNMQLEAVSMCLRDAHQFICEREHSNFIAGLDLIPLIYLRRPQNGVVCGEYKIGPSALILGNYRAISHIEDYIKPLVKLNRRFAFYNKDGELYFHNTLIKWLPGLGTDRSNEVPVVAIVRKDEYESLNDKLERYDKKFSNA